MNFKLKRQIITPEVSKIIYKEVRKQKVVVLRASNKNLREIACVSRAIVKQGLPKNLVRKKLPGRLGYGIFLHPKAKPILKGQIIAPYAGIISFNPQNLPEDALYAFEPLINIVLTKEQQADFDGARRYHPRRLYAMQVDALKQGNFTRFINHSDKPNLVAEFFRIPANSYGLAPAPLEILYLAKKTILPGQQLLISYEGDEDHSYWAALKIKPVPITPKTFQLNSCLELIGSV